MTIIIIDTVALMLLMSAIYSDRYSATTTHNDQYVALHIKR